jgi:hypothetical protein
MGLIGHIQKEWTVLKGAPLSFVILVVLSIVAGIGIGSWHYAQQIEDQSGQINRYRVALGIDKASASALVELNNAELAAKAESTAGVIREICFDFERRDEALAKQFREQNITPGTPKAMALWTPMATEIIERFDQEAKPDFANVDSELRKRLGSAGMDGMIVMAPSLPFNVGTLVDGPIESLYICKYADELDAMAKRLPVGK